MMRLRKIGRNRGSPAVHAKSGIRANARDGIGLGDAFGFGLLSVAPV
jgi:hypothetical protein